MNDELKRIKEEQKHIDYLTEKEQEYLEYLTEKKRKYEKRYNILAIANVLKKLADFMINHAHEEDELSGISIKTEHDPYLPNTVPTLGSIPTGDVKYTITIPMRLKEKLNGKSKEEKETSS
jgi:hypothetical protein